MFVVVVRKNKQGEFKNFTEAFEKLTALAKKEEGRRNWKALANDFFIEHSLTFAPTLSPFCRMNYLQALRAAIRTGLIFDDGCLLKPVKEPSETALRDEFLEIIFENAKTALNQSEPSIIKFKKLLFLLGIKNF